MLGMHTTFSLDIVRSLYRDHELSSARNAQWEQRRWYPRDKGATSQYKLVDEQYTFQVFLTPVEFYPHV